VVKPFVVSLSNHERDEFGHFRLVLRQAQDERRLPPRAVDTGTLTGYG